MKYVIKQISPNHLRFGRSCIISFVDDFKLCVKDERIELFQ